MTPNWDKKGENWKQHFCLLKVAHEGSIAYSAKAEFGRLKWERRNWLTSPREGEGLGSEDRRMQQPPGASESQSRSEWMRFKEDVSFFGSLDPLALLRDGVVCGVS